MKGFNVFASAMNDYSNLRAEDGYRIQDSRSALHNSVLALILLFAIILLLLTPHLASGQAVGGRIAGHL